MILKLMIDEDLADDNPAKGCSILANIIEVKFSRLDTGERSLRVHYSAPNRGLMSEDFILHTNAYLMNDNGRTIQSFSPS